MNYFNAALGEFEDDIARAEHLLNLLKAFKAFGASEAPVVGNDSGFSWIEADALHSASKRRRTDLPVMAGSLVLYMAGRFEFFIRQLVEAAADEISSRYRKYEELPQEIKSAIRSKTLEVAQNNGRYGFNEVAVNSFIAQLAKNLNGELSPPEIPSKLLSITEANMKDRVIADLMKRIGMDAFWKELGKQAPLKIHLEKTAEGETTNEAISRLNKIMDERNQIAHPTAATDFPDPDQVLNSASFLKVLARVIVDVVLVHMVSMKPK